MSNLPHLWIDSFIETVLAFILSVQILLELVVRNLISFFVFAIVRQKFLYSIISKMHRTKAILNRILIRSSPDIAKLIPIALDMTINTSNKHIMPYIKFPLLV